MLDRSDPPGLCAGEKLADHAAGGQEQRVLLADVIHRRAVVGDVEAGLAVGEVKRPGAFGDQVVAARLEQPRRAGVIGGRVTGAGIVRAVASECEPAPLRSCARAVPGEP